jgi:hypothetical protein
VAPRIRDRATNAPTATPATVTPATAAPATAAPATAGHDDSNNPLWLIAIAMAMYFGLAAVLIAAD